MATIIRFAPQRLIHLPLATIKQIDEKELNNNMKILIIEDEEVACRNLKRLLLEIDSRFEVVGVIPSISEAVEWFLSPKPIDLIFLDIHLSDGNSFEIFRHVSVETPIVFTTAYDEYALKAFELNSVDYLLKPIHPKKLERAIDKYKNMFLPEKQTPKYNDLLSNYNQASIYKSRFLVKSGQKLISVDVDKIAYFLKDDIVLLVTPDNHRYSINYTLEELEGFLNPDHFFRLNRQFLIHRSALKNVSAHFKGKLKVSVKPDVEQELIVSQERAAAFKAWLGA